MSGGVNPALSFDGTDDHFEIADSPSLQWENSMSVFLAYKILNITSTDTLLTKPNSTVIKWTVGATVELRNGGNIILSDTLVINVQQVLTITKGSGTRRLRIDGVDEINTFNDTDLVNSAFDVTIGALAGGAQALEVNLNEVVIYDRVVTNNEVSQVENYLLNKYPLF